MGHDSVRVKSRRNIGAHIAYDRGLLPMYIG